MENCVYWKTPLILSRIQLLFMLRRDGRVGDGGQGKEERQLIYANIYFLLT